MHGCTYTGILMANLGAVVHGGDATGFLSTSARSDYFQVSPTILRTIPIKKKSIMRQDSQYEDVIPIFRTTLKGSMRSLCKVQEDGTDIVTNSFLTNQCPK